MNIHTTSGTPFCLFCFGDLRMQYPGGDPENGPAQFMCDGERCGDEEYDAEDMDFKHNHTVEESHEYALMVNGEFNDYLSDMDDQEYPLFV